MCNSLIKCATEIQPNVISQIKYYFVFLNLMQYEIHVSYAMP